MVMSASALADPYILLQGNPNVRVDLFSNVITADITIYNSGSDMTSPWIIEMQPVPHGQQPASVTGVYPQATCDTNTPQNVHEAYALLHGQTATIHLTSSPGPGTWDVYLFSRNGCANQMGANFMYTSPWAFW